MNYFTQKELSCKCCDKYFFDEKTLEMLNEARKIAGIPFIITSGYRCEKHNKEVGGVVGSAHTKGLAVDIRFRNSNELFKIIKGLIMAGFVRIGINYKSKFIHTDTDATKPQKVFFKY